MRTSDSVSKIAPAFRAAQQQLNGVAKKAKNPFYDSTYATLDDCWKACKSVLHEQSISVSQATMVREIISGGPPIMLLTTRLQHDSGEFFEGEYLLNPVKADPQGYGSAVTYARRYSLCAMVGLCPEEDDDGNAASGAVAKAPAQRATPKKTKSGSGDELRGLVGMWSGVNPEDIGDAVKTVFERIGLPTDKKKITADHLAQAISWTKTQMNTGVQFTEATAKQGA